MMKKIFSAALAAVLLFSLTACSPQPDSMLDALKEVSAVRITSQEKTVEKADADWIDGLVELIGNTGVSRENLVNDTPLAEEYVTVDFIFDEEDALTSYLYEEEGVWYLEFPYQGLYVLDETVADYITDTVEVSALSE